MFCCKRITIIQKFATILQQKQKIFTLDILFQILNNFSIDFHQIIKNKVKLNYYTYSVANSSQLF